MSTIVWAIDVFSTDKKTIENANKVLIALSYQATSPKIRPLYLLTPDTVNTSGPFSQGAAKKIEKLAMLKMKAKLRSVKVSNLLEPKVLTEYRPSMRSGVDKLSAYANQTEADFILVSTRAREGIDRLVLGSFSESLVLFARKSVLILNPRCVVPKKIRHIVFGTDFSQASKQAFKIVLELAQSLAAEVIVYHKLSFPLVSSVETSYAKRQEQLHCQRIAAEWKSLAGKKQIPFKQVIIRRQKTAANALLDYIRNKKGAIVAMASQSKFTDDIPGVISREVIRKATCPVWILRN